jgi:hypothetical protein
MKLTLNDPKILDLNNEALGEFIRPILIESLKQKGLIPPAVQAMTQQIIIHNPRLSIEDAIKKAEEFFNFIVEYDCPLMMGGTWVSDQVV